MESYWLWMITLFIIIIALKLFQMYQDHSSSPNDALSNQDGNSDTIETILKDEDDIKSFASFKIKFTFVFLMAMFADWCTGPFLYDLYQSYLGKASPQIAILYIVGFAASAITSTFIGTLADKYGRRKICLLFCITYALCGLVKHYNHYALLICARLLGGFSTSILFSCFESWMISEHHNLGYKSDWMGSTFQLVWGLNSIVAIAAGLIGQGVNNLYAKYPSRLTTPSCIAVFDLGVIVLICTFVMICLFFKNENYGNSEIEIMDSLKNTMMELFHSGDYNALKVGLLSACFEGAMYIFVFKWTPVLQKEKQRDLGNIFAVFMMGCLVGTLLNGCLKKIIKSEKISAIFCLVAGAVMIVQRFVIGHYELNLCGFIVFEICVGMYWPIIGGLREQYISDNVRATVMNLFRIPLNLVVIFGLLFEHKLQDNIFILLGILLWIASGCALFLCCGKVDHAEKTTQGKAKDAETQLTKV